MRCTSKGRAPLRLSTLCCCVRSVFALKSSEAWVPFLALANQFGEEMKKKEKFKEQLVVVLTVMSWTLSTQDTMVGQSVFPCMAADSAERLQRLLADVRLALQQHRVIHRDAFVVQKSSSSFTCERLPPPL